MPRSALPRGGEATWSASYHLLRAARACREGSWRAEWYCGTDIWGIPDKGALVSGDCDPDLGAAGSHRVGAIMRFEGADAAAAILGVSLGGGWALDRLAGPSRNTVCTRGTGAIRGSTGCCLSSTDKCRRGRARLSRRSPRRRWGRSPGDSARGGPPQMGLRARSCRSYDASRCHVASGQGRLCAQQGGQGRRLGAEPQRGEVVRPGGAAPCLNSTGHGPRPRVAPRPDHNCGLRGAARRIPSL
jgi:hypothetical protein